jgi:dinuclear metal center YbgI/SA1388 family protein
VITLANIAEYLDGVLDISNIPDYSNAINGIQLSNQSSIRRIAASVDLSTRTIEGAISADANLLIVHHGMFWNGLQPIRGSYYQRLKMLMDNDIAVYAAHLPLDKHAEFGNNTLLAQRIGLTPSGEFARYKDIFIGVSGEADVDTEELVGRVRTFAKKHGGEVRTTQFAKGSRTQRWAICTGSGASSETLREADETGIDTLIVGEGPHHTAVDAMETGLTIIYAGHYATETLGVQALAQHLSDKFAIPWTFIEAPTGL